MQTLLTSKQMKTCDEFAIRVRGIPSAELMERAAARAVEVLLEEGFDLSHILVLTGGGNNGGDGFAMARMLFLGGYRVSLLYGGNIQENGVPDLTAPGMSAECRSQFLRLPKEIPLLKEIALPSDVTCVVDALFGIGVSRPITGRAGEIIDCVNRSGIPVFAVDMPSGIHADTGEVMGRAIQAKVTVTFACPKRGQFLYPGRAYCGKLICRGIGVGTDLPQIGHIAHTLQKEDLAALLPKRNPISHKGTFGRVLVIGGSPSMAGAAYFSALAAYRTGAGLVEILTPTENRIVLQTLIPEAIVTCYENHSPDPAVIHAAIHRANAVVIGPGMGQSEGAVTVLTEAIKALSDHAEAIPAVLDADALNLLAIHPELRPTLSTPIVLTPHPAEASRLSGIPVEELLRDLPAYSVSLANQFEETAEAVCVLKHAATVVASRNGELYLNHSGNSSMATGGSGDVLTGVIAGLLATDHLEKTLSLPLAAALGVFVHGLAGDLAAKRLGEHAVMASDLANAVGEVLRQADPSR